MFRKLTAYLLSAARLTAALPVSAFAAGTEAAAQTET